MQRPSRSSTEPAPAEQPRSRAKSSPPCAVRPAAMRLVSQKCHFWDTRLVYVVRHQPSINSRRPMSQMFQIHSQLREMILSLDLGPGERLTERWLEGRFEGSRTPIRAALARLESEDLVRRDGRNWMVAPIDLSELEALAEFREPLETTAIRLACARASEADLVAIDEMLDAC